MIEQNNSLLNLYEEAVENLRRLIRTQSFSGQEQDTAQVLSEYLESKGIKVHCIANNLWSINNSFDAVKPTILLNSHHDTVKPTNGWTVDPLEPQEREGKIIGLGSNDAGAPLVSLLAVFLFFANNTDLKYNLIFSATAEEENSGPNGVGSIIDKLGPIDFAIVGEPTGMEMAVAEKGLIVLDCTAIGKSGHAARNTGENAIYKAMKDIGWLSTYQFPNISRTLGPVKMSVTIINAGTQHNVIPDRCMFTVDIRTTDAYSHDEIMDTIKLNIQSEITRCSLRLKSSAIDPGHPIVHAAKKLGINTFGSPTLSDQAVLDVPSVKIGPGMSERSHTADEFVYLSEIEAGIEIYKNLLASIL